MARDEAEAIGFDRAYALMIESAQVWGERLGRMYGIMEHCDGQLSSAGRFDCRKALTKMTISAEIQIA